MPYVPSTPADQAAVLERLGLSRLEDLFAGLPTAHLDPPISLPQSLDEQALVRHFAGVAARNAAAWDRPSFLGAGAYRHFVPAVVDHLVSRSEFATAYTPYQPEISQGTLQAAFEYQSTVCELTGMDVSNTGLYDVGSATAEACLLAARVTGRRAALLLEPIHPGTVDVVRTYALGTGLRVDTKPPGVPPGPEHACVVVQQPDFLGGIVDVEPIAAAAHAAGALCVVVADPFSLGLLRPPGDAGADVVTGEGRDLAGPPSFGGPSLGLFATKSAYLRQVPGRIVGRTKELRAPRGEDGSERAPRTGYVLTLQAREQFIRRERATSNFSTGQSLVALAFTVCVQALGPSGLRAAAMAAYQAAHDAARRIAALPGFTVVGREPWFHEFLVRAPLPPEALAAHLRSRGIVGGFPVDERPEPQCAGATLFCVTDATPPEHVNRLIEAMTEIAGDR